jgi:hypothetical protein
MKIISWNIRGFGGIVKRKEVRKLVGEKFPNIVSPRNKVSTMR